MSIDRWMGASLAVVLHAITLAALFAGLGALGAAAFLPSAGSDDLFFWVDSVRGTAWGMALIFVPGAAAALFLMPPRAAILQRAAPSDHSSFALMLRFLMAGLALVAAVQVLPLAAWWFANLAMLRRLVGPGADPLGWSVIPAVILLAVPALSATTILAFVLISGQAILVRAGLIARVLGSGVALQAALGIGSAFALDGLTGLASKISARFSTDPELAGVASELTAWIARQQSQGGGVTRALLWTLGGYLAAAASAAWLAPPSERTWAGQAGSHAVEPDGPAGRAAGARAGSGRFMPPAGTGELFDRTTFVVQPRVSFVSFLTGRHTAYDIWAYGDARGGRLAFSFQWTTGTIRREPAGPDVVSVRARRMGPLARGFDVIDASTGSLLGSLRPDLPDWEVLDHEGEAIARVEPDESRAQGFVARVNGSEICRYGWHLGSRGALNPELEIEFASAPSARPDRALLIGLGPVLEQKARLAHRRGA